MQITQKKTVEELLKQADKLPPLPAIASKALRLMRDPDFSMKALSELIATDVSISSTVLRWANSSLYALSSPVSTITQAVNFLGANVIRSLVLSVAMLNFMEKPLPGYNLDKGELWKHSLGMAIAARLVMTKYGPQLAEEAYTAGLVCDVGKLVFEAELRDLNLDLPELEGKNFAEVEKVFFGMSHADMGAELARRWEFPEPLMEAIAYHHAPAQSSKKTVLPAAVHIADNIVNRLGIGLGCDGATYQLEPYALQTLGLSDGSLDHLLAQTLAQFQESESLRKGSAI